MREIEPNLKKGDVLIVAGDFGFGFWDGVYWPQEMFFDHIAEQEYTLLFIDGNHEHFDKLNSLPESQWNGGKVHRIRHNVIHLMRGEIFEIEDVSIFAFGGGFSLDKARWRQISGLTNRNHIRLLLIYSGDCSPGFVFLSSVEGQFFWYSHFPQPD